MGNWKSRLRRRHWALGIGHWEEGVFRAMCSVLRWIGVAEGDDFKEERSVRSVQRTAGFGSAFGGILKKKALRSNAIRNFSLFTFHSSLHNASKEAL